MKRKSSFTFEHMPGSLVPGTSVLAKQVVTPGAPSVARMVKAPHFSPFSSASLPIGVWANPGAVFGDYVFPPGVCARCGAFAALYMRTAPGPADVDVFTALCDFHAWYFPINGFA